jgi:hypothetical protein
MSLNDFSIVVPDPLLSIEVLNFETMDESLFAAVVVELLENHAFDFVKFVSLEFSGEPVILLEVVFAVEETKFGSQNDVG